MCVCVCVCVCLCARACVRANNNHWIKPEFEKLYIVFSSADTRGPEWGLGVSVHVACRILKIPMSHVSVARKSLCLLTI